MNVVALVQARMGSTRLPGKVLADLAGRTVLARVVRRTRRAKRVDRVVVATTAKPEDDPIIGECERLEVNWFRGSEDDVLDRYCQAAAAFRADVVVRITADCPLIDPQVIDRVVERFLFERPDYAANTLERTFPRGLDTETVAVAALARSAREAREPYERVHVTPYLYRHPEMFRLLSVTHDEADCSGHRWTVDTADDLALLRALYDRLDGDDSASWQNVLAILAAHPELADLNRHVRHKALDEG